VSRTSININPLDLQKRKAIGVSIPFSNSGVFNSTFQTKDAIRINLINFLLTGRGERFLNVGFGAGLRNLIFENITESRISALQDYIIESINNYFPSIIINNFNIDTSPTSNLVRVFFKYEVSRTGLVDEILIDIQE
jgi:phage baseplate assembly protein W